MTWKTAIKISLAILIVAFGVAATTSHFRSHADAKAITLGTSDLVEMNNISIEELKLNLAYKDQMAVIHARYMALRDRNKVPADWTNDTSGSTVIGFRPETPEEKAKRQ